MLLTEEQQMIRDVAKKFSEENLKPYSEEWAKKHQFPTKALKELAELGFMGMLVPEQYQGSPIGHVAYVEVIATIAEGDASTSTILSVHNSLANKCILQYGNDQQKEHFLKPMARGEKLGAFCLSEPQAGSDAANIKTTAKREGDFYILNGTKQFITSGKHADIAIVFALTDPTNGKKGISCFIVPTNTKGYQVARVEEKMGQHAAVTVQLNFDNLKLPAEYLLGQEGEGYKIALSQLEGGRIGIAAQCIGIANAALKASLQFAKERVTFGKPIIEHQAIAFKLADMATEIEASHQLTLHAATLRDQGLPCLKEASMAKLKASEMVEYVCREAIQIHGGYGYLSDFPVERLYRDARVTTLYEGTSEVQRILISRMIETY